MQVIKGFDKRLLDNIFRQLEIAQYRVGISQRRFLILPDNDAIGLEIASLYLLDQSIYTFHHIPR